MISFIFVSNLSLQIMKKIEKTARKVKEIILPTIYLAPMFLGAYGFISFVQWTS